jgi:hypothetical protein
MSAADSANPHRVCEIRYNERYKEAVWNLLVFRLPAFSVVWAGPN